MKQEKHILWKDEIKALVIACLVLGFITGCMQVWNSYCSAETKARIAAIEAQSEKQIMAQATGPEYVFNKKHRAWVEK